MNRAAFADALRKRASGVFGTSISGPQWQGTEAILDSCARNNVTDGHHVANILAQIYHETGGYMSPIKETVYASHTNKNPSDATVINRLNNAWAKGQLTWVKTPYWRPDADGKAWFGRGQIQLTHKSGYAKMGERLGVNLVGNPALALDPKISADIAVVGMSEGHFTGRKLSDFNFPAALNNPVASNPRRIVNGQDGTDKTIAGYHRAFHAAIEAGGGWHVTQPQPPKPAPTQPKAPETPQTGNVGSLVALAIMAALVAAAIYIFS